MMRCATCTQILPNPAKLKIADQADRQKQQEEFVGIEQHWSEGCLCWLKERKGKGWFQGVFCVSNDEWAGHHAVPD